MQLTRIRRYNNMCTARETSKYSDTSCPKTIVDFNNFNNTDLYVHDFFLNTDPFHAVFGWENPSKKSFKTIKRFITYLILNLFRPQKSRSRPEIGSRQKLRFTVVF